MDDSCKLEASQQLPDLLVVFLPFIQSSLSTRCRSNSDIAASRCQTLYVDIALHSQNGGAECLRWNALSKVIPTASAAGSTKKATLVNAPSMNQARASELPKT